MVLTLVISFVVAILVIFWGIFDDVERSATQVCAQFHLGESWNQAISVANQNGWKPYLDKKNSMISFLFDGGFLDIAGCELYFENNKLTGKNVWVD